MSLLLSPLILYAGGMLGARIHKARRVWKPHGTFAWKWSFVLLAASWAFGASLFVNAPWVMDLFGLTGAQGTNWMVNSGILSLPASWPVASKGVTIYAIVAFGLFPLWLWLGATSGFILFGRSPKQTGVLGLLR